MPMENLPFDERACFIAGAAKSGTTLLVSLLDSHPELLVLMMEAYAQVVGVPLERIKRWVEKTPANRNYVPEIFNRFPKSKLLLTMRDPRALLAAQIALESTRKTR